VAACLTTRYLFVALCGQGYTVATIDTYKTFFFSTRPRGKFAGKPILFPELLTWRRRFGPLFAVIWVIVLLHLALALREPPQGVLRFPSRSAVSLRERLGESGSGRACPRATVGPGMAMSRARRC
jgi:hypothetical protein